MPVSSLPRIGLAQMQVRPGRPDRNVARMLEMIAEAREAELDLVAFPELCVCGYLLGDAWEVDALVRDFESWNEVLRSASEGITLVYGNVALDPGRTGEDGRVRKFNAVYVYRDGAALRREGLPPGLPGGVSVKTLHPNYRFFDDDRHFCSLRKLAAATGRPVADWLLPYRAPRRDGGEFRFGVQLCEDLWCADYEHEGEVLDTLEIHRARGAELVINLSASPWTRQKDDKRHRTVREALRRSPLPFFYVNQVGAMNNGKNVLVFDGGSTVYARDASVAARAPAWRERLLVAGGGVAPEQTEAAALRDAILTGLRHLDEFRGVAGRFLVGVSGGVDSSVVLALLVQAFGPRRVFAVNVPTRFNSRRTRDNARSLCRALGVEHLVCPIDDLHRALAARIRSGGFAGARGAYTRLVDENLQARLRGAGILAGLAARFGLLFTNNGNKTELALGYATLYGDVNGAVAPLADLYKPQVFALARHLNEQVFRAPVIPENLYDGGTVPSAELSAEQDVTRGLGDPIKYGYHDAVLHQMIEQRRHGVDLLRWFAGGELLERLGWPDRAGFLGYFADSAAWVEDLEWVAAQLRTSVFKRVQAPPLIVLGKRAFGFDLRESQLPAYPLRAAAALRRQVLAMPIEAALGEGRRRPSREAGSPPCP